MMTRRFLLAAAAVTSASAALPSLPAIAAAPVAEAPKLLSFIAGTEGEYDWRHIRAETPEQAAQRWLDEMGYWECEAPETGIPREECECHSCGKAQSVQTERVAAFDNVAHPTGGDWLRAGYGYLCDRCSYEVDGFNGGHAIGDLAICDDCLTAEERAEIDGAAEAEASAS